MHLGMRTINVIIVFTLFLNAAWNICHAQKRDLSNPFTLEQIHRVGERIPHLRQGMTIKEVFKTLGINHKHFLPPTISGPAYDHRVVYQLRIGYNLELVFDDSERSSGGFKRAFLITITDRQDQS